MPEAVRLTCEQCKRKKTRCDKLLPCSSCKASGAVCRPVQRARLPRGKTGKAKKQTTALEDKVARLESLIVNLEAQTRGEDDESDESLRLKPLSNVRYAHKIEEFAARDFWVALSQEVHGLRETLEASEEDENESDEVAVTAHHPDKQWDHLTAATPHTLLFGHHGDHHDIPLATPEMRIYLQNAYRSRVDCLLKVLHWPTALSMLQTRDSEHGTQTQNLDEQALESAIYFLAICSTSEQECHQHNFGSRRLLLKQYQHKTETALSKAGLLICTSSILLQAFVLYLSGLRCTDDAANSWALIPLAIRIADACRIGVTTHAASAFDLEIRRRIWFAIGFLDSQASFGRGSTPLVTDSDLANPPRNINDNEMFPDSVAITSAKPFTDMSFTTLIYHVMQCQRKLIDPAFNSWQDRVNAVHAFELFTIANYGQFEFSTVPLQRYAAFGARGMVASLQLVVHRPPYKNNQTAIPPPDNFNVLQSACRVLQTSMFKSHNTEFAMFSWFSWPKWYALAILLVELCSSAPGPDFDRGIAIAQESYNDYAQCAPEASSGVLWKPITKLMRKAEKIKAARDDSVARTQRSNAYLDPPNDQPSSVNVNDGYRPSFRTFDADMYDQDVPPAAMDQSWLNGNEWVQWDDFLTDVNGSEFTTSLSI